MKRSVWGRLVPLAGVLVLLFASGGPGPVLPAAAAPTGTGTLTVTRHGTTVSFSMKYSAPVQAIDFTFYDPSDVVAQKTVHTVNGSQKVIDVSVADFAGASGYCVPDSGEPNAISCERQGADIPARQVIRGTIKMAHIKAHGAAWADGWTSMSDSVRTPTARFN
jgi:hypothetical protein